MIQVNHSSAHLQLVLIQLVCLQLQLTLPAAQLRLPLRHRCSCLLQPPPLALGPAHRLEALVVVVDLVCCTLQGISGPNA